MRRSMVLPESIADAVEWMVEQIERHPYSEVGLLFSCHGGEIRRIDKTVSQKEKVTTAAQAGKVSHEQSPHQ